MVQLSTTWRWSATEFLRDYDAGVFDGRVELVEGYVHTSPIPGGYDARTEHVRGEQLSVPYADVELAVSDLLGA